MRNLHQTNKEELISFLRSIDPMLHHRITLIAVGGTARQWKFALDKN